MHTDKQYTDRFAQEVIDLHVFFEDWFGGYCENSEEVFAERLLDRMHGDFNIILPGGMMIYGANFWPEFRKLYGSNPDFHISIRAIQQHPLPGDSIYLVNYQEWQRNALQSKPENNGRLSSAVFVDDKDAPNGVKWFHVHETWLPDAVIAAEAYDWEHS